MAPPLPRCECVPLAGHQVSFRIDGRERLRWHYGPDYPRPFFWPLVAPDSDESLTRIGHPGAPNHDHHRSVWFAHAKVQGVDFWSESSKARIEQKEWLLYEDADDEAVMAVRLEWRDGHDAAPLLTQELIAALRPWGEEEYVLDLQSVFTPRSESIEFQQSNFGLLAVRVARSLSTHFGSGTLSDSEGRSGEPEIFGKTARWVDYSGRVRKRGETNAVTEAGITYVSHPSNSDGLPQWHVRADGWMGCSVCFNAPRTATRVAPLNLRYLLYVHRGLASPPDAQRVLDDWLTRPARMVVKSMQPHRTYELQAAKSI